MKLCISLKSLSTGSFPPYLSTPCFERLQRDTPLKKNAFLLFLDHLVLKNKHHFNEIRIFCEFGRNSPTLETIKENKLRLSFDDLFIKAIYIFY